MKDYTDKITDEEFFGELSQKLDDSKTWDVSNLTQRQLLDDDTFYKLFDITDMVERTRTLYKLEERAKQFGCQRTFKGIYKAYLNKAKENFRSYEKPGHFEIAESLLDENSFAVYDGNLYMYVNGVYQSDRRIIEKKIVERIPEADSHFRSEVYKDLELRNEDTKFEKDTNIINFKNGLFNVGEKKLYKHSSKFFSINQIPVEFTENPISSLEVDDFFEKISSGNEKRKQAILEMIGYCMTTSVKLQKAFILYGETARNGKSTLCTIITALLGQNNISNISLKDMSNNIFSTSGIKGKLLNIGAEMTEEFLKDTSIFKMLTTGDSLAVEEKFKTKQTISPYAKLLFNANALPVVSDKTNGFYRRLHIIPLETSFSEEDAKHFDINKLLTKEALEYLAYLAVDAFSSMDGRFANYEESDAEVKKYRHNSNSILAFLRDRECNPLFNPKSKICTAKTVYDSYKDYCISNQYQVIGRNKFYDEVEKTGLLRIGTKDNQKVYKLST